MNEITPGNSNHEMMANLSCAECENTIDSVASNSVTAKTGIPVCSECIELYYIACANCLMYIPRDESLACGGRMVCADCYAKPQSTSADVSLLENPEALISEYIALHAEEKRIKTRMEELKEVLKEIAAAQQRISNAVTLRAGDVSVKCSFRSSIKCNQEVVESLAERLDKQEFEALFERKVSYSPHKESVQDFLNHMDDERAEARELLRSAIIETETVTLTIVANRK